jgi:hypothetical protein
MRGRKLRSGSLVALVGALVLVLGAAPTFGQEAGMTRGDVYDVSPEKNKLEYPHRAGRVNIKFRKPLVTDDANKPTSVSVRDECGRLLSNNVTEVTENPNPPADGENGWFHKASVQLDRRNKNPSGWYDVTAEYWLETDEEGDPPAPGEDDPPAPESRTYSYRFKVHGGPNCDGSPKPGHGGGHGGGGDKKRVWGNTSGTGHNSNDGHTGHDNLRTATGSTTDHTTNHTTDFSSFTSPLISSSGDHSSTTHTGSTTPFGEDDFGDPFGDTTGTPPLSDPTDPSLYDSEAGQIPEEAEDQQTLSAAPADDLEPEPSMLVVALALALLLGVGGGLFLRRTDPAPIR